MTFCGIIFEKMKKKVRFLILFRWYFFDLFFFSRKMGIFCGV